MAVRIFSSISFSGDISKLMSQRPQLTKSILRFERSRLFRDSREIDLKI